MATKFVHPYKPFTHPFAFDAFELQNQIHWMPKEISLIKDKHDFEALKDSDKEIITKIFRFFTQTDIEVNNYYLNFATKNPNAPTEINLMFSAFMNMEAIHVSAYSYVIESFDLPETIYREFLDDKVLMSKYEDILNVKEDEDFIFNTFWFSYYLEGISLYGMFFALLSFTHNGQFLGMGQIIAWSIRDEELHVRSMLRYAMTMLADEPSTEDATAEIVGRLVTRAFEAVELEKKFITNALGKDHEKLQDVCDLLDYLVIERANYIYELHNEMYEGYLLPSNPNIELKPWIYNSVGYENMNNFNGTVTQYNKLSDTSVDFSFL